MPSIASFVYSTLGRAYRNLGCFSKALEHHNEHLTMAKEVGDRAGQGAAYANLSNAYQSQGDFSKAIKYHTQDLAIAKEVGDRAGEGGACGNLGNVYQSQGDYAKAIEYHTQDLAIAKEGDRAGGGQGVREPGQRVSVAGGLQQGHRSRLAIAKEVSDRAGEARACGNLGSGHLYLNKSNLYLFLKAVAYFEAQHALAISLKLAHMQSDAALNMGVALTLHVRAARKGPATGADQAPGPHSHSSASS
jgi:tetratricopeptide (TPR) repeat protein